MSDTASIVQALLAVMTDVQAVGKRDRNTQQGYNFRGIDAVINAVGPAFRKHGVIAVPVNTESKYRDVQTSTGKPSRECTVTVTYRFYGPAGDHIDAVVPGEAMDVGDKGAPKAMSVALRIALLQALCIPTDEPDPDAHSYERAAPDPAAGMRPDPITDWEWGNRFETRLAAAGSLAQLRGLWEEMALKHKTGQLADDDRAVFEQVFDMRKQELEASPS